MNPESARIKPNIRRLWQSDRPMLVEFFQKVDLPTRRLRFGAAVSDRYAKEYAERILSADSVVFGAFPDGTLRGVAELRGLVYSWPARAEAALMVEADWQQEGIGDALFSRVIAAAQNRGIKTIYMLCLRENQRMQSLAKKHDAVLEFDTGDVEATLDPPWPTPLSLAEEVVGDTYSYLRAVFHLRD